MKPVSKTGWPPGLLQDDSREFSRWLASKPNSRALVREKVSEMTRDEKIQWMAVWAAKNNLQLVLDGTVGFGRPCVGVLSNDNYPEYNWFHPETYDRIDQNGDVWQPPNAYHKHPCVAVLGTGEEAESQLYDWLKWFDQNNFKLQVEYVELPSDPRDREIHLLLGKDRNVRLVKEQPK